MYKILFILVVGVGCQSVQNTTYNTTNIDGDRNQVEKLVENSGAPEKDIGDISPSTSVDAGAL